MAPQKWTPRRSVADENRAGFYQVAWSWLGPLLALGYSRPLQLEDLGDLPYDADHAEAASASFTAQAAYFKQRWGWTTKNSMWGATLTFEWRNVLAAGLCKLIGDLLGFVSPIALAGIVKFVTAHAAGVDDERWQGVELGYLWLVAAFVSAVLQNICLQNHHQMVIRAGIRAKCAVSLLVYRKALTVDTAARQKFGQGMLQNLQSSDAFSVNMCLWMIHYSWAAPLQIAIAVAMLYQQLGPSCFVGLAVLVLLGPIQSVIASIVSKLLKQVSAHADKRIRLLNELVTGIRIIKFFAFENDFVGRVTDARAAEMRGLRAVNVWKAVSNAVLSAGPLLVALLTFLTYGYVSDTPLTPSRAFASLALFSILRLPLMIFPGLISSLVAAGVALTRLASFTDAPDRVEYRRTLAAAASSSTAASGVDADAPASVVISAATLRWPAAPPAPAAAAGPAGAKAATAPAPSASASSNAPTDADIFRLRDINTAIPAGKLTMIVGAVGSGKSSLLASINGEMVLETGSVALAASSSAAACSDATASAVPVAPSSAPSGAVALPVIAYSAQQSWVMNATVKQNILFGSPLDDQRYADVLAACALAPDLATFPAGDGTEVGENGVSLSGGQRARISLARCLYSPSPLVVLDDVLSAVDAHVAAHLVAHALTGPLTVGRTIILATHQLQYLRRAAHIIVMDAGRIVQQGAYGALMAQDPSSPAAADGGFSPSDPSSSPAASPSSVAGSATNHLARMMAARARIDEALAASAGAASAPPNAAPASSDAPTPGGDDKTIATATPIPDGDDPSAPASADAVTVQVKQSDASSSSTSTPAASAPPALAAAASTDKPAKPTGRIIVDEDRATGAVPLSIYGYYLTSLGTGLLVLILLTLVLSTAGTVGTDWWLSYWSTNSTAHTIGYFVGCYAAITMTTVALSFMQSAAWALGAVHASLSLHREMLVRIVRAPMRFFDSTPVGRILARFSADMSAIDSQLPPAFSGSSQIALQILSTVIVQAIILPYTIIAAVPTLIMFVAVQQYYRRSVREIKRLDQITKSPVFAFLSETLTGIATVRAYGQEARFAATSATRIDTNTVCFLKQNLVNRWSGIRFDLLGSLMVGTVCLVAVFSPGLSPGLAGLAISYALSITGQLNWMVRMATDTETYLASAERIQYYASVAVERPPVIADHRPPPQWPQKGEITFEGLTATYRQDLPPVLSSVSFHVPGGSRVAICGRTGSGKSSLMLTLFRILEAAEGRIVVDGIDISTIGLDDLRSRLAIIPQDPVLFSGSLRYNLDPTGKHTAEELIASLDAVSMGDYVRAQSQQLEMAVEENGANFSVGQRQLLCMARALLRNARILVLDEATASTDVASDAIIQQRLRSLPGVTQLVIAHRINTILDCDRVCVLDHGRLLEFGTPQKLLETTGSEFGRLVRQSAAA